MSSAPHEPSQTRETVSRSWLTATNRGQSTFDFAIGIGIFIVVVTFVLSFVPGMLQPFESNSQQHSVAADRAAERLAGGTLADPRSPGILHRECTVVFFEDEAADGSDADLGENTDRDGTVSAPFDDTGIPNPCSGFADRPVRERLTLDQVGVDVRVSLQRDLLNGPTDDADETADVLCLDADSRTVVETGRPDSGRCDVDEGDDDVVLSIGETPPTGTGSVAVATRLVHVTGGLADGTAEARLVVEVW